MSCVFAKQKRQRVAKFATLLQCTKKSLMGTRFYKVSLFLSAVIKKVEEMLGIGVSPGARMG